MAVKLGTVSTFENALPDKAQVVKILEESAEVFGAWQDWNSYYSVIGQYAPEELEQIVFLKNCIVHECADVIQATCNFLAAFGVYDLTAVMDRCKQKNIDRGREYE